MSNTAVGFSFLAVVCWALGALFDKYALRSLPPDATFFARFYLIFVLMFPFLVLQWDRTRRAVLQSQANTVFFLLGSVVFTVSGVYFYYHALSQSEAERVVPLCSTYPLAAFFLAAAFLGEPITALKLLGVFLVTGGVLCLTR